MSQTPDVIVIGAGNAALCAAITAREAGAEVLILERAPENEWGGNTYFAGGIYRFAHNGIADICSFIPQLAEDDVSDLEADPYTEAAYFEDMGEVTHYRCDPELTEILITQSRDAAKYLGDHGVGFHFSRGRHSHKVEGKFHFFGGAPVEVNGGGAGLATQLLKFAESTGVTIKYNHRVVDLDLDEDGAVIGVRVKRGGRTETISCKAVVLACGGFESNAEWRARYLGPNWDLARVRGTKYNTGDGHQMAIGIGARPFGHWSGCHATAWDANAPLDTDPSAGDTASRHSYPMGLVVNIDSERFLDEGANFHTHTYAKYGAEILKQPGLFAFQLFDQQTMQYLRNDYREKNVSRAVANTIEDLAKKLELDPEKLAKTVADYNEAVGEGEFNPNILDGKRTHGLSPDKTNWALPFNEPPYYGYAVTTGLTFTFGGLRINEEAQVLDWSNQPISGLFAAGEIVGGLFYHNYPSGTGLVAGTVFGRIAGKSAATTAS